MIRRNTAGFMEGSVLTDFIGARAGIGSLVVLWTTLGLLAAALAATALWARNIGVAEDWHMFRAMLHQQDHLLTWIWSQNNEHRLPLQRVMYLLLLWATHDFRSGMVLNQILMAVMAWILARASASARRDEMRVTDALFPLAVLHLGHYNNLVLSWQLQFVWSVFLIGVLFALVVSRPGPLSPSAGRWAALLLILLPLSGANGIAIGLAMAPWLAAQSLVHLLPPDVARRWFGVDREQQVPLRGGFLLLGATGAVFATMLYFMDFVSTDWKPWVTSLDQFLVAVRTYFVLALGPGGLYIENIAFVFVLLYLVVGSALTLRTVLVGPPDERLRATGLTLFIGSGVALGLIIAFVRGGDVWRLPDRYALFSVMPLLAAGIALRLYASEPVGRWAVRILFAAFIVMLPLNIDAGFTWRNWYVNGMRAVEADIAAGASVEELADRHYEFLLHWDRDQLREGIQMLKDAGLGPFAQVH